MGKIKAFFKQETVLCVAVLLALVSMFLVHPDATYIEYIDFKTLALLFCLMGVMAGLQSLGVFEWIAGKMLKKVSSYFLLFAILIFLCFFFSMLITNDVALITFVPFTFTVLKLCGKKQEELLVVPIVVMQTIAANLGSMLTPVGNPQNLYLYGKAQMALGAFLSLMAPYTLTAFILLVIWCVVMGIRNKEKIEIALESNVTLEKKGAKIGIYLALFALSLATVVRVVPFEITLLITIVVIFLVDRKVFKSVDYSLLITFVGFFVFIGNMGRIPAFSEFLQQIVAGNEVPVAILLSQVISNVPAALLLSGFTDNTNALLVGVDLGGLGTLIASMASLISYKYVVKEYAQKKGKYFTYFTIAGICFLVILVVVYIL